jgi:hypothetical protein
LVSFDLTSPLSGSVLNFNWNPTLATTSTDLAFNALGAQTVNGVDTLFVTGNFNTVKAIPSDTDSTLPGSTSLSFDANGFATLNANWNPQVSGGNITSLNPQNGTVFLGGLFQMLNTDVRNSLASYDSADQTLTDWNPGVFDYGPPPPPPVGSPSITVPGTIYALALSGDGTTLVAGGNFNYVGISNEPANERLSLASFNLDSNGHGTLNNWTPSVWATTDVDSTQGIVSAILWQGTDTSTTQSDGLYIGGDFEVVGDGTNTQDTVAVAKYTLSTSADPAVDTTWSTPADTSNMAYALAISEDAAALYVGGGIFLDATLPANQENNLVSLSTTDGSTNQANFQVDDLVYALVVSGTGDNATLYVGGSFNVVGTLPGSTDVSNLTSFNISNSTASPIPWTNWAPAIEGAGSAVRALARVGTLLYVGGTFDAVGVDQTFTTPTYGRNNLAVFEIADGSTTSIVNSWAPSTSEGLNTNVVNTFALNTTGLDFGGDFFFASEAPCFFVCRTTTAILGAL